MLYLTIKTTIMNYNHNDYISSYDGITVNDALEIRIEEIKKTLKLVTDLNKWDYRYAEGKWNIKEVVQHCIDCERIFSNRALHIARNDQNTLFTFDENEYVTTLNSDQINPEILVKEWLHLMNATYFQFEGFYKETFNKKRFIGENELSVKKIGYIIAGHSIHHINVIKERYL